MPRPPIWQRVRTNSGWHLRLMGTNGEPIWTTEVYNDKRTVLTALALTLDAAHTLTNHHMSGEVLGSGLQDVDERINKTDEPQTVYIAECREDSITMPFTSYEDRANWVGKHRLGTGHTVDMYTEER